MLRVGLTGDLGSGKSTVARLLGELGARVLSSDEMGRAMMQPGHAVYQAIADRFGPAVVLPDGQLNRPELARLAFDPAHPRVEELNAIVHPAVLAEQERLIAEIAREAPESLVVIESALILTSRHDVSGEPWKKRFDRLVVVTAPEELKVERFALRSPGFQELSPDQQQALRQDARARLKAQGAAQIPADAILLENAEDLASLERKTLAVFQQLRAAMPSAGRGGI